MHGRRNESNHHRHRELAKVGPLALVRMSFTINACNLPKEAHHGMVVSKSESSTIASRGIFVNNAAMLELSIPYPTNGAQTWLKNLPGTYHAVWAGRVLRE
jgi:hypothetical protein